MVFMCKGRNQELIDGCSAILKFDYTIGRPMVEILTKDIYYYNHLKDLCKNQFEKFDFLENFLTLKEKKMVGGGSLNHLLSDFV